MHAVGTNNLATNTTNPTNPHNNTNNHTNQTAINTLTQINDQYKNPIQKQSLKKNIYDWTLSYDNTLKYNWTLSYDNTLIIN